MTLVPVTIEQAQTFVRQFHRHGKKQGPRARFAIGLGDPDRGLLGVVIVGRPVAHPLQDGWTAEVNRCCVLEDAPKGATSKLYAAAWRAWRAMGGKRLVTYTLQTESGASLRGAGWRIVAECKPRPYGWSAHNTGRYREYRPIYGQAKFRWEATDGSPLTAHAPGEPRP